MRHTFDLVIVEVDGFWQNRRFADAEFEINKDGYLHIFQETDLVAVFPSMEWDCVRVESKEQP